VFGPDGHRLEQFNLGTFNVNLDPVRPTLFENFLKVSDSNLDTLTTSLFKDCVTILVVVPFAQVQVKCAIRTSHNTFLKDRDSLRRVQREILIEQPKVVRLGLERNYFATLGRGETRKRSYVCPQIQPLGTIFYSETKLFVVVDVASDYFIDDLLVGCVGARDKL